MWKPEPIRSIIEKPKYQDSMIISKLPRLYDEFLIHQFKHMFWVRNTGLRSTVGNVSCNRCESDCRSRGCEFDPGPVPYLRGD